MHGDGHGADSSSSSASPFPWPSPAQRVLRVLQVTRTHWRVPPGGRRKWRTQSGGTPHA